MNTTRLFRYPMPGICMTGPPAARKELHIIPNADHNSLMMVGGRTYFEIIRDFILHSDME